MKTSKIWMVGAMLLMMLTTACRDESDKMMTYDHEDVLAFDEAYESYAGKFKVTWHGLNQYYALWDYEKEQGLDWDAVYDEYLPQFEALDERGEDNPVTDDEMKEMMRKMLSPLHDGHLFIEWQNHATGTKVGYSPSADRDSLREDGKIAEKFHPSLKYYGDAANGEVMMKGGQPVVKEYSTLWKDMKETFWNTPGKGMKWIEAEIARIDNLTTPTELEVNNYTYMKKLMDELEKVKTEKKDDDAIKAFNKLAEKYSMLEVPAFEVIDEGFIDAGINVKFALLKGNIAYFYFSGFTLSPYLLLEKFAAFDMTNTDTKQHVDKVTEVWTAWFDAIQELHKAGTLGGVIIDVRGNGGGYFSDAQFVAGALLPSGGFQYGYSRFKRGTGRYDYSPLMPSVMETLEDEHETVDDVPVVLLVNCGSVSMSEMTAQTIRLMKNGTLIGKRTHGGLCGLMDNPSFSLNYTSYIGIRDKTPVFVYLPLLASFTLDKKQLEGYGHAPDIDVDLDTIQFKANGRDTQMDRALRFIREGN